MATLSKKEIIAAIPGLKDVVELLDFGFSLKDAFVKALADGSVTLTDLLYFFDPIMGAKVAFEGVKDIPAQWANASQEDRAELMTFFAEKFDLNDDGLEALIEQTLNEGVHMYELILKWVEYRKGA